MSFEQTMTFPLLSQFVKETLKNEPTGHDYLDTKFDEQTTVAGHVAPYYRLIHWITRELKPDVYVELGVDKGLSIGHAACGCPETDCVGVDPWVDYPFQMEKVKEMQGHFPNIRTIRGFSVPVAKKLWARGRENHPELPYTTADVSSLVPDEIDVLFIDAWHRKDLVLLELELYGARVPKGGLILFDDVSGRFSEMEGLWPIVCRGKWALFSVELSPASGFGVIIQ